MSLYRLRSSTGYCVAAILVLLLPLIVQLALWCWQPLFYDEWRLSDRMPFFHWWPGTSYYDQCGNAAIADLCRNVTAVFLVADSDITLGRFVLPHPRSGGVAFPGMLEDGSDFFAPRSRDMLYVFAKDGTCAEFPLSPGESRRYHDLMTPDRPVPNIISVLEGAYAEKHPPEQVAKLHEAVQMLQEGMGKREQGNKDSPNR